MICSGNGNCDCDHCNCKTGYSGDFCEKDVVSEMDSSYFVLWRVLVYSRVSLVRVDLFMVYGLLLPGS